MAGCISRILAEKDLRGLQVASAAQAAEGFEELSKRLVIEMTGRTEPENPMEATRDEEGFEELRAMQF